jgi:hypothetical protein
MCSCAVCAHYCTALTSTLHSAVVHYACMLQQKLATAKKEYNVLSNMYDTAVEMRDLILQGGRVQLKKAKAKYEAYTQSLMADYQAASDKVCAYCGTQALQCASLHNSTTVQLHCNTATV